MCVDDGMRFGLFDAWAKFSDAFGRRRKIDIYQMEQEYIVGDGKNLQALKEKLEKDFVLLREIEEDFNQNPIQFKNEYVNAKTSHLKNRYMYYWSFLKWYFDQALFAEHSSFPDFQKEQMKKQGWMFPHAFINTKITTSGGVNVTTEELYMRNFNRLFDELFGFNIGEKNSRIDRYYKQAIFNYRNKCSKFFRSSFWSYEILTLRSLY